MKRARTSQAGATLVEVTIAMVVSGVIIAVIIGFMITSLTRYGIASARADLLNDAQAAFDITSTDIRLSAVTDANNRWDDNNAPNAPTNKLSWQSSSTVLVLATAAQTSSGDVIFSDASKYISQKNNIIYFVKNNVLYKRTLAAPVSGNVAKTTCPKASATTSCPADKVLLNNVDIFTIKYFNNQNQEVSASSEARSVEFYVKL